MSYIYKGKVIKEAILFVFYYPILLGPPFSIFFCALLKMIWLTSFGNIPSQKIIFREAIVQKITEFYEIIS